ncbi:hypothetical protein [Saccharothrix hoggarensis]|uniref:Lsr2 protein n=1 Tax=Saccharothrix hoggarensis TaxID=913853 RepID=A0ABW3R2X0_9PSEU
MLYLLLPNLTMQWSDIPATSTIKLARENGADLSRLPWQPSERPVTTTVIRWAMRHGVPCSTGLILHAGDFSVITHPEEIRQTHADAKRSREEFAASPAGQLTEHLTPGSAEQGRQLEAKVDESTAKALEKADRKLQESLAVKPDERVVAHWRALGGIVPTPA